MSDRISGRRAGALTLLASAQLMLVIDSSIVNVALPSIEADLHMTAGQLSWVVNAYVLAFGGFLLLGGRLGDLVSRRRLFMVGLGLFAAASLLGGFAQAPAWLFAARAAQGLAAALTSPTALSLLTTTFPEGQGRGRALGVWGAAIGAGGACGVLLGGLLTSWLGWQWVLFVNVPVGLAAILLTPALLPEQAGRRGATGIDLPGVVVATGGLALLVFGLVDAERTGWLTAPTVGRLAGAVALLAVFVVIEKRVAAPLVPLSIFRNRQLSGANAVNLLLNMTLLAMFFFIALYLQRVLGLGALLAGVAYLPLTVTIVAAAQLAGRVIGRFGTRTALAGGLVTLTVGLAWFAAIDARGSYLVDVLGPSLLCGAGMGLSLVAVTVAATSRVEPRHAGLASGLVNTTQQIGGALGLAVIAGVATAYTTGPGTGELVAGFRAGFLLAAAIAAAAAGLGLVALRGPAAVGSQPT
ncbi:DHA2 family efflux MFS transporter permease subunit [Pseudonocardia acaciae]|uniref:DHA2 family efflux MFS transporter permease subunit n=1 Tax=Pseudonocardia acaciae TaxID=551276 RepID=UPI00068844D5|nr:DHA2 family efflux MFS transporter permease subunit [Pseudonocardia acaciae]